jgi:LacI family transcriptional regulator
MATPDLRPTIRDIARKAGCHYSTVSLALRNHPRIPVRTKEKIQAIAVQLGYRADAMLAALCAYREMKRPAIEKGVIAWLTNHRSEEGWKVSACNRDYFHGASCRAAERGYRLEELWLAAPGMNGRRMSKILWTRGIQGVLLPPQEKIGSVDLEWSNFSAVTFGYTLTSPRLHLVSNHEYRTMGTLFSELNRRGYRRVGLVNLRNQDERVDHNWLAAYLVEQNRLCLDDPIPPLIMETWCDEDFLSWLKEFHPDAIVTKLPDVLTSLKRAGFQIPEDIGVAYHSLDEGRRGLSGMKKNAYQIGVMAVDLLVDMLHRNERGIPLRPYLLMVEGTWYEGNTVRGVAMAVSAAG